MYACDRCVSQYLLDVSTQLSAQHFLICEVCAGLRGDLTIHRTVQWVSALRRPIDDGDPSVACQLGIAGHENGTQADVRSQRRGRMKETP
jgi:hypothetical protein